MGGKIVDRVEVVCYSKPMTTLVAISTKDALIMGCDSLASVTVPLVNVNALAEYFENQNEWPLKLGSDGKPLLKNFGQVFGKAQLVPYTHMTHVSKLFSLTPLPMGVMTSGIASIGQRTIKSLINQFKNEDKAFLEKGNYTVNSIGSRLLEFLKTQYCAVYPEGIPNRPELELIIGGYSKTSQIPSIYRIRVHENKIETPIVDFGIVFGGQMEAIQRIVFGSDFQNKLKMVARCQELLLKYHDILSNQLKDKKVNVDLPVPSQFTNELGMFNDKWDLNGFNANWGDFSEQNAVECVDFFINIMIKSQQFSTQLPTVGGEVHIGIATKDKFRFVSREELSHAGHSILLEED